jgi:hypothetical protein
VREVESQAAHDALGLLAVEPVAEGDHGLGHVAALDEGELPPVELPESLDLLGGSRATARWR